MSPFILLRVKREMCEKCANLSLKFRKPRTSNRPRLARPYECEGDDDICAE
jgi:hypothetical protein